MKKQNRTETITTCAEAPILENGYAPERIHEVGPSMLHYTRSIMLISFWLQVKITCLTQYKAHVRLSVIYRLKSTWARKSGNKSALLYFLLGRIKYIHLWVEILSKVHQIKWDIHGASENHEISLGVIHKTRDPIFKILRPLLRPSWSFVHTWSHMILTAFGH